MTDKEWAEFKEKFSNELQHGRTSIANGGARNGETNFPDRYDPIGKPAAGVLDENGKYHYDSGGSEQSSTNQQEENVSPQEAQAQANEQTVANDQNHVDSLKNSIANVSAQIKSSLQKASDASSYAAKKTAEKAAENGKNLLDRLKDTLSAVGSNLKNAVSTVSTKVKNTTSDVGKKVSDAYEDTKNKVSTTTKKTTTGIGDAVKNAYNKAKTGIKTAAEESKKKTEEQKKAISDWFKNTADTTKKALDIGSIIDENKAASKKREDLFRNNSYMQQYLKAEADMKYGDSDIKDDDDVFTKLAKKIRGSLKEKYIEDHQYKESWVDRLFKSDAQRKSDFDKAMDPYTKELASQKSSSEREREEREAAESSGQTKKDQERQAKYITDRQNEERQEDMDSIVKKFLGQEATKNQMEDDEVKKRTKEDDERAILEEYFDMDPDEREAAESSGQISPYIEELIKKYGYRPIKHSDMSLDYISDSLEHHGIKGQRWGERSGPPYPLSRMNKQSYLEKGAAYVDKAFSGITVNQLVSQQKSEGHVPSQKGLPNNNQGKPNGDTRKADITPTQKNDYIQKNNNQQQQNKGQNTQAWVNYMQAGADALNIANQFVQNDIDKKSKVKMDDPRWDQVRDDWMEDRNRDWQKKWAEDAKDKWYKNNKDYKEKGITPPDFDELSKRESMPSWKIVEEKTNIDKKIKARMDSMTEVGAKDKVPRDYDLVDPTERKIGKALGYATTAVGLASSVALLIARLKDLRSDKGGKG